MPARPPFERRVNGHGSRFLVTEETDLASLSALPTSVQGRGRINRQANETEDGEVWK
jgi:hypothetical protein